MAMKATGKLSYLVQTIEKNSDVACNFSASVKERGDDFYVVFVGGVHTVQAMPWSLGFRPKLVDKVLNCA